MAKKSKTEAEGYTDEGFDAALSTSLAAQPVGSKPKRTPKVGFGLGSLRQMLKVARSDPQGWTRRNREDVRRGSSRRVVARRLHQEVPDFTEEEHAEFLGAFQSDPTTQTLAVSAWDEEKKAKWLKWIERVIPVLKVIAAVCPPPYNLVIIAVIVVLTLIAENRLQPAELSEIFRTEPTEEAAPAVAV